MHPYLKASSSSCIYCYISVCFTGLCINWSSHICCSKYILSFFFFLFYINPFYTGNHKQVLQQTVKTQMNCHRKGHFIWAVVFATTIIIFWAEIGYIQGAQCLSGRVLDTRPRGRGFEPHRHHCVVSLS